MKHSGSGSRLMVFSVDGLHPSLYRRAHELGVKVPNILDLVARGASAEAVESVYPSTTYPAHATLVTGVSPRVHGIYSHLTSLDPTEDARPWHWFAAAIQVPALWNLTRAHGLKSAAVGWPVSAGAPIDWNIPEIWDAAAAEPQQDLQTVARHSSPGLFEELVRALKPSPHEPPDRLRGDAALYILRKYRPHLMLVHFVGYDQEAHRHGPRSPQALKALELTDREMGRLREAAKDDERLSVVVLSDHGFLPVEKEVAPLTILAEEDLFGPQGQMRPVLKRLGAVHAGGSFSVFWLEEPSSGERRALDRALDRLKETGAIAEVLDRSALEVLGSDPDAEWMLDAADGFYFSSRFEGSAVRESKTDRGTHGQLPTRPGMEAAFVAAGPDIKPGKALGHLKLTDVAPTLAQLLGVGFDELAGVSRPLELQ